MDLGDGPGKLIVQTQCYEQSGGGGREGVHAAGTLAPRAVCALAGRWEESLCLHWLPGPWPQGCREESTTHTAGDAQVPALGNTE